MLKTLAQEILTSKPKFYNRGRHITEGREYHKIRQQWEQKLAHYFSSGVMSYISAILDRTWQFLKDDEMIPERHFLEGVIRHDGVIVSYSRIHSRSSLKRYRNYVESIKDANGETAIIITCERLNSRGQEIYVYRPNLKFNPETAPMLKKRRAKKEVDTSYEDAWSAQVEESEVVRRSKFGRFKRDQSEPSSIKKRVQLESVRGSNLDLYKGEEEQERLVNGNSGSDAATPRAGLKLPRKRIIRESLKTENRPCQESENCESEVSEVPPSLPASRFVFDKGIQPRRALTQNEDGTEKPKGSNLSRAQSLWMSLERDYVTTTTQYQLSPVMAWGRREQGMMKTLINKWIDGGGEFEEFLEIITNSLTQWVKITESMNIRQSFQPSLGLFVKCFSGFRDYQKRGDLLQARAEEYREIVAQKRDAANLAKFKETGELDRRNQKEIDKANRKIRENNLITAGNDAALAAMRQRALEKERLDNIYKQAALLPPPEFDDDGMPIVSVAMVYQDFSN